MNAKGKSKQTVIITILFLTAVFTTIYYVRVRAEIDTTAPYFFEYVSDGRISDYLREELIRRNREITIGFRIDETISYEAYMEELLDRYINEIFENAVSHLGIPDAGDYLRNHIASWGSSYSVQAGSDAGYFLAEVIYHVDYYTTAQQEKKVSDRADEIIEELHLNYLGEYDACYEIYKYITSHVKYDYEHLNDDAYTMKYTAYAALFDGKAVCQGYASLFYFLANKCDLSVRMIPGYSSDGNEPHMWNIVRIGGSYYNVDCTWDAGKKNYDYFLKCDTSFSDHVREPEYSSDYFYESYTMAEQDYIVKEDFEGSTDQKASLYTYKLSSGGNALITGYSGKEKHIVVPAKLDGHPVYAIDARVFDGDCTAETITLSEGIKGWYCNGDSAFFCCENLKTVNLPSTVGFPDGSDYDLSAGNNRFYWCEKLKTITIAGNNPYMKVVDNVLFTKDGKTLIYYPMGKTDVSYKVPAGVTGIDDGAFRDHPYLTSVKLPDSLDYLGWWAFSLAENLSSVTIPEGCTYIGGNAFSGTALRSIHIPAKVEYIVPPALDNPDLAEITVSGDNPYYYTKDGVLFSRKTYGDETVTALECYPAKRNMTSYTIPEDVTEISPSAFGYAEKLESVTGGKNVKSICSCAFYGCSSLEFFIVPDKVTVIENLAFMNCYGLKTIYIPASVKEIQDNAFANNETVILFGEKGSVAQVYAKEYNLKFQTGTAEDAAEKAKELKTAKKDAAAAEEAAKKITALAPADELCLADKKSVEAAAKAYKALTDNQKKYVPAKTVKKLQKAEKLLKEMEEEAAEEEKAGHKTVQTVTKLVKALSDNADLKDSDFMTLSVKVTKAAKHSLKLTWNRVSGAAGYLVFAARCGKGSKYVQAAERKGAAKNSYTLKKIDGKKLSGNTYYKVLVVAYKVTKGGEQRVIAAAKAVHAATSGGKNGNPAEVTVDRKSVTLKAGKSVQLKAQQHSKAGMKIKKHRALQFESSDSKIATVSRKGVVKGKKKGKCTVYIYAQNGLSAKVLVTVKKK